MSHFRHPGERTAPPAVDAAERRRFLAALSLAPAAGAVSTLAASSAAQAQTPVNSQAHIVIVGGGAAGLTAANRLAAGLKGAKITLIDARKEHFYQPGFTLVAAGIKPGNYVVTATADYLPQDVEWVQASAAEIDPEARKVVAARPDISPSAADVLKEPVVVCRASGTCVVKKEDQRIPESR